MIKLNLITLGLIKKYHSHYKRWYNKNLSAKCCDKNKLKLIKEFSEYNSKTQNNFVHKQSFIKTT